MEGRGTDARFPTVDARRGHYESFYMRAFHPEEPLGVWIRYTTHKRPGGPTLGSLWFTLFERGAGGPRASKVTVPDPSAGGDDWIRIGDARFGPGRLAGAARTDSCDASWDLRLEGDEPPVFHLPRDWMYRAPVPRTKTLSPHPAAAFSGTVEVDGRRIELTGWPGAVGHNWGAQHAERWIWLHGIGFEGRDDAWIDAAIGRIKLGPVTTPWIANGVLSVDGERHRLGGPGRARSTKVDESPTGARLVLPAKGATARLSLSGERSDFVGWVYADPDGPDHNTVNCSIAGMELSVERPGRPPLELRTGHGATYELGMRERDHGIPIQPFPDGEEAARESLAGTA